MLRWSCQSFLRILQFRSLLLLSLLPGLAAAPLAAQQAAALHSLPHSAPSIMCARAPEPGACGYAISSLDLALATLRLPEYSDWRIVVVADRHWSELARSFGVAESKPAFSSLAIRTTYLRNSLLFLDSSSDTEWQAVTPLVGRSRIEWIVAHEFAHLYCATHDERRANAAAARLRYSDRRDESVCR